MPKWKKEELKLTFQDSKAIKFTDNLYNNLYLTHYLNDDSYSIEYYGVDSQLRLRCQNLPGYQFIQSYNPDRSSGIWLKGCKDKEVISTFLAQIDKSNPLENVKADVFAFFGLPCPVPEEKFVEPGVRERVNELSAEIRQQKNTIADLMECINELKSTVAELKKAAAAAPKKDDSDLVAGLRKKIEDQAGELRELKYEKDRVEELNSFNVFADRKPRLW